MSTRLYHIDVEPGEQVLSKVEVRFLDGQQIRALPEGSRGTVQATDGIDAVVIFEAAPEVQLRVGRYELRRATRKAA